MTFRNKSTKRTLLRGALGLPAAAALAGLAYSTVFVDHSMMLPNALSGQRREIASPAGRLAYYTAGQGEPLLLIHSVNAAASAYEMRPLYEHYRASRRVYALDLPGFGFSERGRRAYSPRLYADAIVAMLDQIRRDTGADEIDALALSLGCEFLARAASEHPDRFDTVALVSPTGLGRGDSFYGPPNSLRGSAAARAAFEFGLWAQPFYDALASRSSIRYFLAKTFGSDDAVDEGLLEYGYLSAHQSGARHAPYTFISGQLFSADINRVYEALSLPVFAAHGVRGDFTNYGRLPEYAGRGNWTVAEFQTGALPYFEAPEQFIAAYDAFLARALA